MKNKKAQLGIPLPIFIAIVLVVIIGLAFFSGGLLSIIADDFQTFDSFDVAINWVGTTSDDGVYSYIGMQPSVTTDGNLIVAPTTPGNLDTTIKVNKDFKGMDIKITGVYRTTFRDRFNTRDIVGGLSITGVGFSKSSVIPGVYGDAFLYEAFTSRLDSNVVEVFYNGQSQGIIDVTDGFFINIDLTNPSRIKVDEIKFRPQFSCNLEPGDAFVVDNILSTTVISHKTLEVRSDLNIKKYCLQTSPIQIRQLEGVQINPEIIQRLARGDVLTVPSNEEWIIFFITDNEKASGCGLGTAFDAKNNECKSISEIMISCLTGVEAYNSVTGRCEGGDQQIIEESLIELEERVEEVLVEELLEDQGITLEEATQEQIDEITETITPNDIIIIETTPDTSEIIDIIEDVNVESNIIASIDVINEVVVENAIRDIEQDKPAPNILRFIFLALGLIVSGILLFRFGFTPIGISLAVVSALIGIVSFIFI